jgi:hypothetical protein
MGARTTLILVLLAALLAALLLSTDEKPPARESAEITALDGRSLSDSTRIRWQLEGRQAIELVRQPDGGFRITEPIEDLVAQAYLKQIFTTWDSAQVRATPLVDDEAGRQRAGLTPPALTFTVEFSDGVKLPIEVGGHGPLGTSRFLRRDGRIWEGSEALYETMRVGTDDLRERSVFRNEEATCSELRVDQLLSTGKRETLHLVRDAGAWRLKAPRSARADPEAASQFLTSVLSLRVDDFPPGMVRYPDREPEIVVMARGTYGDELVRLWQEQGAVFGALPARGVAFSSGNRQYCQVFENAANLLRARILLPMRVVAEELAEVVCDPGQGRGDRLRLQRSSDAADYMLVEPVEYATQATPCQELVQALNNLHAMEFVEGARADDPALGLGTGRLQVSARGFQARRTTTLWFGAAVEKGGQRFVHCCREDEPDNVVLVPEAPVEFLRRPWTAYCNTDVLRVVTPVERVELRRRTGGADRVLRRVDGRWVLDGTDERKDESGGFVNDVLRDLRGERAVDLRGDAFGEPDWTVGLQRANGDSFAVLQVWDRSADAPLVVRQDGGKAVGFEVPGWIAKSLRDLWR